MSPTEPQAHVYSEIALLRARLDNAEMTDAEHAEVLRAHTDMLKHHGEVLTELRLMYGNVATKDDIHDLREDVKDHVPGFIVIFFIVAMVAVFGATLVFSYMHGSL